MRSFLKKVLPQWVKRAILVQKKEFKALKQTVNYQKKWKDQKKIIMFGTPTHGNLGDHAIILAQVKFLKKVFNNPLIIEIPTEESFLNIKPLKKIIHQEDIIILSGGGNMGNLYIAEEIARRKIIQSFPHNKIIQFPHSYTFTDTKTGRTESKVSKKLYSKKRNDLVITARETRSLNIFKHLFTDNKIIITPDIVFTLNEREDKKREGILICLRNDVEQVITKEDKKTLIDALKHTYNSVKITDTSVGYGVNTKTREVELNKKWDEFRTAKVVITDRLHGMVFAVITGTPCIAFDNFNSKVQRTFLDWLQTYENIRFLDVKEDFDSNKILELIKEIEGKEIPIFELNDKYDPLVEALTK